MRTWPIERKIRYEGDLNPEFAREIISSPGGEQLSHCIQCGTCSATCPLSIRMDYTPRRIIAMTRAGFMKDVLGSFTIWLCASCYSCTVECPRNIKITDIMYMLKRRAIETGLYPRRFGIPALAQAFFAQVRKNGRTSEFRVIVRLMLKTNPFQYAGKAVMGLKLFLLGRLSLKQEKITGRKELKTMMNRLKPQPPADDATNLSGGKA